MTMIAAGDTLEELLGYEHLIPEGSRVRFVGGCGQKLSPEHFSEIHREMAERGIVVRKVWQASNDDLVIDCEKHMPPLAIILIALGILTLPAIIFSWRLFMMSPGEVIGKILPYATVGLIIVGLVIYYDRKRIRRVGGKAIKAAAPYAIRASKMAVTRRR